MLTTSKPYSSQQIEGDHIMTNYKLAYIEHIIQLLICKLDTIQAQTNQLWREIDSVQSDLNALSRAYADWFLERRDGYY